MTEIVSSFLPVKAAAFEYIFLLCNESQYTTWIRNALDSNAALFGEDLGIKAKIVHAYQHQSRNVHKELCSKAWPKEIGERIIKEQDPFMLIVRTDFASFDPNQDEWRLLFLSDFRADPDSIARVFAQLAKLVREELDVFKWLDALQQQSLRESVTSLPKLEVARGEGAKQVRKRRPKGRPGVEPKYDWKRIFAKVDELYNSKNPPTSYGDCAEKISKWAYEEGIEVPGDDYLEKKIGKYTREWNK